MKEKKSAIVERIDTLLGERKQSRKALIGLGGIKSVQTITDWSERGTLPRADVALAIADYFGVSVRWLLTGKDEQGLSRDERNLLSYWDCLTEDNRRMLLAWLDMTLTVQDESGKPARTEPGKKEIPA
jgi:transcriptional regulator with XRE-family HTH domain